MARIVIVRIAEGEKAWSWEYEEGLPLEIKKEPYTKKEIIPILKTFQQDPIFDEKEGLVTFYAKKKGGQQLAWWKMGNDPIEKVLTEIKNAKREWQNPEDDPDHGVDPNMQNNTGTGRAGSKK